MTRQDQTDRDRIEVERFADEVAQRRHEFVCVDGAPLHQLAGRSFDGVGGSQPDDIAKIWNWKGYLAHSWHRVPVSVG